jgi:hypothetical protein
MGRHQDLERWTSQRSHQSEASEDREDVDSSRIRQSPADDFVVSPSNSAAIQPITRSKWHQRFLTFLSLFIRFPWLFWVTVWMLVFGIALGALTALVDPRVSQVPEAGDRPVPPALVTSHPDSTWNSPLLSLGIIILACMVGSKALAHYLLRSPRIQPPIRTDLPDKSQRALPAAAKSFPYSRYSRTANWQSPNANGGSPDEDDSDQPIDLGNAYLTNSDPRPPHR